jgi:hypothetical protein
LDPPFSPLRPRRGEYGYGCFSDHDLGRLIDAALDAEKRGVKILLSYSNSGVLKTALKRWWQYQVPSRRHVAGDPAARVSEMDILISNYRISHLHS